MTRLTVSEPAERTLDAWLDQTQRGQLPLWELPLCVSAWWHAGTFDQSDSAALQIQELKRENARLNRELDVLWARAFLTPDQRRERILQRLEHGLVNATEERWTQLDKDLAQMAGQQLNKFHSVRTGPAPEGNGAHHDGRSIGKAA